MCTVSLAPTWKLIMKVQQIQIKPASLRVKQRGKFWKTRPNENHYILWLWHMKHEGQSKYSCLHGHPGLIKQGNTMLTLFTGSLSPKRGPGDNWEGKPLCRVGLYTELFYAIISTLFLCFLLIYYPYISLHF